MTEHDDIKTSIVEVQAQQQVAIDNRDTARSNELYAKELALRSEMVGLGQEGVEGAPPRSFLTPKSSETSPGDYLLHTNLISTDDGNLLGDLVDDPDVAKLADIVGASVRAMISSGRMMAVDSVVDEKVVDDFLDDFTDQEKILLKGSVTNFPRALTVASRFVKLALRKDPDLAIPDDYSFWIVALPAVERIYHRLSRARPEDAKIMMTGDESNARDGYLETLDAFHERIAELQSQGRYTDANRVYADEQAWLASTPGGNQPIVGSSGRTV